LANLTQTRHDQAAFEGNQGRTSTGGVSTQAGRRSRLTRLRKFHDKTARRTHRKFREDLDSLPASTALRGIDNGSEIARDQHAKNDANRSQLQRIVANRSQSERIVENQRETVRIGEDRLSRITVTRA
jgi:hypothetical protein